MSMRPLQAGTSSCLRRASPAAVRFRRRAVVCNSQLGLLYTSCSGSTAQAAELIIRSLGAACSSPTDVQHGLPTGLQQFDGYVVGAPTYNTNATCQRTGTAWDDLLYSGALQELQLEGKPFAVFGCGDAVRFKNNFADAVGEIHDVLAAAGGIPLSSSYCCPSSYLMQHSKAIRTAAAGNPQRSSSSSSSSQFVGLPLDYVNQPELSADRIHSWCQQLVQQLQQEHPGVLSPVSTSMQQQPVQQQQQQLATGDWPAEWPRQGLFQAEYPKGFRFMDRWYQLGDRWYRFHDEGFQVRAGFREHAVYTYAYRDVLAVEVRQLQQQHAEQHGFSSSSSSSSSSGFKQEVWVKVRQSTTSSSSSSSSSLSSSRLLVLKGVESWDGSNTIAEFLRQQMQLHSDSSRPSEFAVHAGLPV